jgi:hypothetical protein
MITLHLYDSVGLGLIFELPTGIRYSHQTGGTSCLHPCAEGAYLPLCNDYALPDLTFISPEIALGKHFTGPKWNGIGATQGLDLEDADFIDSVLSVHQLPIHINRKRLKESHEAWVRVIVVSDPSETLPLWEGISSRAPAILVWSNSD